MNLVKLFRKILPYVRPYKWLVIITLILTLAGSILAQVNAVVLDRTVIIISHSISQIIDSEIVYALRNGRVEHDASARSLNIEKLAKTIES
ncbi:MAG: hypothetical protein SPL35_08055 [Bacteroidales bacterium]|nr:hypothetical protein [Bacteroidales bacterium]